MSIALYRRYRPQKFQDVIGQEHVTKPLMAALRGDRTAHAYLFSGPRGCGKTTSARILARCLNCAEGPTDTPCGKCESCTELSALGSGSLDVIELDAASHGGVDDARELVERAAFAPARDRYKVFIVDEAHMVTNQGFNALLKLVEEPPEHVKFIFATTEPEKVISTIRSRTHHYPFRLVPPDVLEEYMAQLCEEEGVEVGAGVLALVVRAGGGSVRDSLSVLDQLIGGVDGSVLAYEDAISLLGYTDDALLDDAVEALAANDGATLFSVVDRLVQSGHEPRRFVEDLLERLRDLVVLSLAGEAGQDALGSVPGDRLERMRTQADHLGAKRASQCADITAEALTNMVGATSARLHVELLCARLLVADDGAAAPAASAGVASMAGGAGGVGAASAAQQVRAQMGFDQAQQAMPGPASAPAPAPDPHAAAPEPHASAPAESAREEGDYPAPPPHARQVAAPASAPGPDSSSASAPEPSPAPTGGAKAKDALPADADAALIRQRWNEVVDELSRSQHRVTAALVGPNAQVAGFSEGVLTLAFHSEAVASNMHENHCRAVADALYQALGVQAQVRVGGAKAGGRGEAQAAAPHAPAEASEDEESDAGTAPQPPSEPHEPAPLEAEVADDFVEAQFPTPPSLHAASRAQAATPPAMAYDSLAERIRAAHGPGDSVGDRTSRHEASGMPPASAAADSPPAGPAPSHDAPPPSPELEEYAIEPDDPSVEESEMLGVNVVVKALRGKIVSGGMEEKSE